MTIIKGKRIVAAPCCGARYALPHYDSKNFSASEYWTDGWREDSLMPNDAGIRHCSCGRFLLINELIWIETVESSDLPSMDRVPGILLPECIAQAHSEDLAVAARLMYWRHLNHPYRLRYRLHRDMEEVATRLAWEAANPDRRTWWDKACRRKALGYRRPSDTQFTYPAYCPTDQQQENMKQLSAILHAHNAVRPGYTMALAELYRELGRFDAAAQVIESLDIRKSDVTGTLITRLIKEKETAPIRYRMI